MKKSDSKFGGYAGGLLIYDLNKKTWKKVPLGKELCIQYLGGRGMSAKLLFDSLDPGTPALDPGNILSISTGPINGLLGPTTGRMNIASRSPLTNIYGNSNVGSNFSAELKFAGYDGLIIKGRAMKPSYILIEDDSIELKNAEHLWGKGTIETTGLLQDEHGYEAMVAAVGPAAEQGVLFGSIIFNYWDAAGRTGMGTVMASKNLKAIVVKGSGMLTVAEPKHYYAVIHDSWQAILDDPGFKTGEHSALGTSVCVNWGNAQGWLPTRNFKESTFEDADEISGEEFRDKYSTKHAPIPGGRACLSCPNRCKRFGKVESGKYVNTKGNIEFEGVVAFGSKCGVKDLSAVFHAYMLANDYGMDCITCGNTIALFMELNDEGILTRKDLEGMNLRFGAADAMVEMVHRIGNKDGKLGRLGALGSERAARGIGKGALKYTTCVKGLETIACEPRTAKGFGFGFAVASRGSDHLRAHAVFEMIKMPEGLGKELFGSEESVHLSKYGGKVQLIIWHENLAAITDSIGSCRFMHASYYAEYPIPELKAKYSNLPYSRNNRQVHSIKYHEWISAATGISISYDDLMRTGDRIINLERCINVRYGIRRRHDTLPPRFLRQPLPNGPTKGEVFDKKKLDEMLDIYYDSRGWDKKTGLPRKEKILNLGMYDIARDLEKRRLISNT